VKDRLYELLVDEEDARVCRDISEAACRETPGNFFLIFLSSALTKLGDALASPKTLLPWMAASIGVPGWAIGFFVPLRESGSMLPQLLIGGVVRRLAVRKWVWIGGSVIQGVAVLALAGTALWLEGATAGVAMLLSLALFSLARGFCSVASKDVIGKTIPKTRRGRLTGWSSSAAGLITVGLSLMLLLAGGRGGLGEFYLPMLLGAGLTWFIAALVYAGVREFAGETSGAANGLRQALQSISLQWDEPDFGRFVLVRALLLCSALSAPYFVLLSQERNGSTPVLLALFILAAGVADLVSGVFWGRFADRSSRQVMTLAAALASATGLALAALAAFAPQLLEPLAAIPAFYFVLSVAHAGVRVGRKTYVVDLAEGNRRTDYVAVGNSVIGLLLLVVGAVGLLTPLLGNIGVLLVLVAMGLAGSLLGLTLKDV
jgi:hypothetical protein